MLYLPNLATPSPNFHFISYLDPFDLENNKKSRKRSLSLIHDSYQSISADSLNIRGDAIINH